MAMERIYVTTPQVVLKGAHQGENLARCICFPIDGLKEQYGEGTWTIVFRRPFESDPYVVANQEEVGEYAVWGMDATDTAVCGEGRVELRYYVDDVLCKTDVYAVSLLPSLGTTGDAPSPYEDIIDAVAGYAAEARDAVASVPETVAELQAELDEAISGATVDSEVINARVDSEGTTYGTLKQRLDTEHTDLKNQLKEYNAVNLLPHLSDRTIDSRGVTGSVTDDVIVVNGTTSGPLNIRYYNRTSTLPEWWIPGRDVYLHFDKTGTGTIHMIFRISKYNSDGSTTLIGEYDTSSVIHIPEDFDGVGLVLTFYIPTGRTVSGSAHAYILNTKSNQELAAETRRVNELKVACFGDSIMWGRDGNGSGSTQTPYTIPNAIAKRLNCVCDNYGVGGQGFIHSDGTPNAYDNISGVDLTAYTVMVMCYGVNDGFDTVGEWDSTDESTIMGQFNKIVNYVYTQNPNIRLIVFAPWPGRNVGSFPDYWYGDVTVASTGRTSRKILSDAMKRACDYYWIPYVEQYDNPINPLNILTALPDGVHPSNDFYKLIGDWVAAKISGLL